MGLDENQIRQKFREQERSGRDEAQTEFNVDRRPYLWAFLIPPIILVIAAIELSCEKTRDI
jgi:hypothetical protein